MGVARFCAKPHGRKRRKSRRRGSRPAIEATVGSCEDGVMVGTSPLTAKVGLWDTAGKESRQQSGFTGVFKGKLRYSTPQTSILTFTTWRLFPLSIHWERGLTKVRLREEIASVSV